MSGFDPRKMADAYKPDFGLMWHPVLPREQLEKMSDRQIWEYSNSRKQVEEFAAKNPVGSGWILPSWKKVMDDWQTARIIVILGGNRCVRGDTPIYDPVLDVTRRIDSIRGEHHVLASDSMGHELIAAAEQPFKKTGGSFVRLALGNGLTVDVSPAHRILKANSHSAEDNTWEFASNLKHGDWLWGHRSSVMVESVSEAEDGEYWDMTVPVYENYIACGVIHHNSSKSSLAARLCVWAMGTIPECEARAYHINGERSKQDQQRFIWDALPHSLKHLPTKRSATHTVQYTQANGFTGDKMILPPLEGWTKGGQITFSNYASYSNDNQVAEGFKSHIIWLDEETPESLFKTLMQRTTDYRGRIIITFTVLDGWSSLVQQILGKVKTLEYRHAPLLKRKVPVLQESLQHEGMRIHYFWTEDNPFVPVEEFRSKMKGLPEDEILARAYGIPTKSAKAVFTKFDRAINVVKHEDLPFVKNPNYPVTRYMSIDPGGSKNWAMCWLAIDAAGTWWIYREWPDYVTYGAWAEPSATIQGKAGPAQTSLGFGIRDYVELIKQLEGKEVIFERIIDPRMGAAEKQSSDEGATTIISDLDKHDMTVIPAPGVDIDNGIQGIKDLLAWNPEKPRDSINSPKLFISDQCENTIHAFCEYTARGGPEEAVKDFVDGPRYMKVSNCIYVAPEDMTFQQGNGSYGG